MTQKRSCRKPTRRDSRAAALCAILLLSASLGCSRQPPRQPVTLTFLDVEWESPDQLPGLAKDLDDFTRETGIRVKRLPAPDGSLNQLALWRDSLQKGAAAPDVYSIDVIWSGILNPYLMDLKSEFADDLSSQDPVVMASFTVSDKVVAVPHHVYVGVLLYRNDLLRKYGQVEPPRTWDELEAAAARIQAGERANGDKGFWGLVWQGSGEDLTCSALEWQIADGGGRIIENDGTISVNNPQAIHTWERAARWVSSISPPSVSLRKVGRREYLGVRKGRVRSWMGVGLQPDRGAHAAGRHDAVWHHQPAGRRERTRRDVGRKRFGRVARDGSPA